MTLEIYRNGEKVNEITETEAAAIYKTIAEIMLAKEYKRASRTQIDKLNDKMKVIQTFDQYKTQLDGTTYKYYYKFEGLNI